MKRLTLLVLLLTFVTINLTRAATPLKRPKGKEDGIYGALMAYKNFTSSLLAKDFVTAAEYCKFPMNVNHHQFHQLDKKSFLALAEKIFDDECLKVMCKDGRYPISDMTDKYFEFAFDTEKMDESLPPADFDYFDEYMAYPMCFLTVERVDQSWRVVTLGEVRVIDNNWVVTK